MAKEDYIKINRDRKIANEEIYEEIAEELNIPIELVKEVHNAHSDFTIKIIITGAFESIIYPYLGKIKAKLRSVQKVTNMLGKKKTKYENRTI